jgi:hypothetical protein
MLKGRRPGIAGVVLGVLLVGLAVLAPPLAHLAHKPVAAAVAEAGLFGLTFGSVGLLVTRRQPGNPLGWLMLVAAVLFVLQYDASWYSVVDYRLRPGSLPAGWLAVLAQPAWAPDIVLAGLAIFLFPDARLPSRRWRWLLWLFLCTGGVWIATAYTEAIRAVLDQHVRVDTSGNLLALSGTRGWFAVVQTVFFPLLGLCYVGAISRQVVGFRRATGERRLQLRWLSAGATVAIVGLFVSIILGSDTSGPLAPLQVAATVAIAALPISIGVAILRYRLFDIDRLITRTLSYALLTGLLIGVYVGLVAFATRVLPFSSPVAVAGSTLAVVAAFNPFRRRVQRQVDRRFNRAQYDAEATVAAFARRLPAAVDLATTRRELLTVVHATLAPREASLWLVGHRTNAVREP